MNEIRNESTAENGTAPIDLTLPELEAFQEIRDTRPYRDQLHILVVEDQIFSQKLLCDILVCAQTGYRKAPFIDTAPGIQEAWQLYVKKAPDIAFIDLGLIDGSGHTLARAIKGLDSDSFVVIVTASNYEEELKTACRNNVDGFIAKPL
jgi:CheY-like chemotaxis protein